MGEVIQFRSGRSHHPNFTNIKEALAAAALAALDWYGQTVGVAQGTFRIIGPEPWPPVPTIRFMGRAIDIIAFTRLVGVINDPLDPLAKAIFNYVEAETGGFDEDQPIHTYDDALMSLSELTGVVIDIQCSEVA